MVMNIKIKSKVGHLTEVEVACFIGARNWYNE